MHLTEETAKELLRRLTVVENLLRAKESRWVKVSAIKQHTTLTGEKLRRAAARGVIARKKDKTGIWYDLNSVPQNFFKPQNI